MAIGRRGRDPGGEGRDRDAPPRRLRSLGVSSVLSRLNRRGGGGRQGQGQGRQGAGSQRGPGQRQRRRDEECLQVMVVDVDEEKALDVRAERPIGDGNGGEGGPYAPRSHPHPHPFFVGPESILSPRADAWLYLFLSSCASAASLAIAAPDPWRSASEQLALAATGTSCAFSFCVALGMRYRPSRGCLTRPISRDVPPNFTTELVVAAGMLGLWSLAAAILLRPSGGMAVDGSEIWNTNLFFATWTSASLAAYLVADLLTADDASGLLPRECSLVMGNAISRGWTLLFIASTGLWAFSIAHRNGSLCRGIMIETDSCKTTIVGIIFGILGMVFAGIFITISLLEGKAVPSRWNGHNVMHGGHAPSDSSRSSPKKNLLSTVLAAVSFIGYCVNAAFVTSPGLQLGKSEPCNVFFNSWICFALSLYLCIRHAEVFLVPGATRDVRTLLPPRNFKQSKMSLLRAESRMSDSTAPQSQCTSEVSEDEGGGVHRVHDSDEVLTTMVESQSEDGPVVFLPMGQAGRSVDASDIDDDASYPSMTPSTRYVPRPEGMRQFQQREPHKPRSVCPDGGYHAAPSVYSARSGATPTSSFKSGSRAEPPGHEKGNENLKPRDPEDPNSSDSLIGGIDTKLQARVSSSSSERSRAKSRGRGGKSKSCGSNRGRPRRNTHPEGQLGGINARSFHVDDRPGLEDNNPKATVYFAGSESASYVSASNPLDRTTRPAVRAYHQLPRDPSFAAGPSSHGVNYEEQQQEPPAQQTTQPQFVQQTLLKKESLESHLAGQQQLKPRKETLSSNILSESAEKARRYAVHDVRLEDHALQEVESNDKTSVAPTVEGRKSVKSKGSKSSDSKSRTSSLKKNRSKSRDSKKKSSRQGSSSGKQSKSPTRASSRSNKNRQPSIKSSTRSANASSRGPLTISHDSSGPPGQGPPTMSASEGSEPLTNERQPPVAMGRLGPREIHPQSGRTHQQEPPTPGRSVYTEVEEGMPISTIHGSPDAMSMVSEPTMDGFAPLDEESYVGATSGSQRNPSQEFLESNKAFASADKLTYSRTEHSPASSETNENKGNALRQGAVDKMVMEALRQAQEARQVGPPLRSQITNPQAPDQRPLPETSRVGSKSPHRSKSPHGSKQVLSFHKQKAKRSSRSGSGGGKGSIHSFYSESEGGSIVAGDAFAC